MSKIASCIVSSAINSRMASEEHKTTKFSFFELLFFFCAHHEGTNKPSSESQHLLVRTYRKHSSTAFNRPCTEQQSTYSSTFVSTTVRQRNFAKQASMKEQVKCCREPYVNILGLCFPLFSLFLYVKANNK